MALATVRRVGWPLAVACAAACQHGGDDAVDPAYARDVDRICNVVERAGAAGTDLNDRTYLTATWLGSNLESTAGRALLTALQPLSARDKANALETEARRAGLPGCPLAADWRSP